jgi:hypothetical protein
VNTNDIKKILQEHIGDGLAIVVGSGLSCAEGLPGMGDLADYLSSVLPKRLASPVQEEWQDLHSLVMDKGLEGALMTCEPSVELEAAIVSAVIEAIEPAEDKVLTEVVNGTRTLRFTRLLQHLLKPDEGIPVLTTNYDRLIEAACEAAKLPVDTMFDGATLGWHDEKESRASLLRAVGLHGRTVRKRRRKHVRIFKPHGSLDWYETPNGPVRYSGSLRVQRLLITPGRKKLRRGYDSPFDVHREMANRLVDEAGRFLILGYGFNDDHLETRLARRVGEGVKTLILCRDLSARAKELLGRNAGVLGIERIDTHRSRVFIDKQEFELPIPDLWDLNVFIDEVPEP